MKLPIHSSTNSPSIEINLTALQSKSTFHSSTRLGRKMVLLIRKKASLQQIQQMLEPLGTYIKLAVDTRRKILAGGGILHVDCEAELLADGSRQEDIWGADWFPKSQKLEFVALINIRPQQNNPKMEIQDANIRSKVECIVRELLEAVK